MERFLESVGLITGTVKNLEAINSECFLKKDADKELIPNRKEIVKVIKDLQSLLFPNYFKHSEGSENVLSQTELLLNIYNRLIEQIKVLMPSTALQWKKLPRSFATLLLKDYLK